MVEALVSTATTRTPGLLRALSFGLFNRPGTEAAHPSREDRIMTTKLTRNTIESSLNCRNKVHLQLTGQHGTPSDYGLLVAARDEVRRRAIDQILTRHPAEDVERD